MADGSAPAATARYGRKREAILAAATEVLNRQGVKGMTLALVAEKVGLITTSVTYYFKKKEELASACFLRGLERLGALVDEAGQAPDLSQRLWRLLDLYLDLRRAIAAGEAPPVPVFSDIRALTPPHQAPVVAAYFGLFGRIKGLLAPDLEGEGAIAVAQLVLEQLHWSAAWIHRYEPEDIPRLRDRMHDILMRGFAPADAAWVPARLDLAEAAGLEPSEDQRETFLLAATRLINQQGYRGASVEKISAQLGVTKGSFYHHHAGKDELVVACFQRAFDVIRHVQTAVRTLDGPQWLKLSSAAEAVVEVQMSDQGPLLRASALAALPETLRQQMLDLSYRVADRWAAMIADGVADGSLRPVDPMVGAQMLQAALNAAADLRVLLNGADGETAASLYIRPLLLGLERA